MIWGMTTILENAYERVTYRPEGSRRSRKVYLHQPAVVGAFLTGIEVDREGDEVAGPGYDNRRHVLDLGLVVSRESFVMDRIYGELVPADSDSDVTEWGAR